MCTDLDEVFHPGWRQALEAAWLPNAGQARYRYTWSFQPDGREGVVFWCEKIHRRHGYRWAHPVHEVLQWEEPGCPGPMVTAFGVQLDHHPDPTKSRGQYLPLLELSVREAPDDDRNVHYLGREYLFYGRWDDCITTLKRHLSLPAATWADERAASMRYIGQAYLQKGQPDQARSWFLQAIAQAPHLREPWMEMAQLLYAQEDWEGVLYFTGGALAISDRPDTYICEAARLGSPPPRSALSGLLSHRADTACAGRSAKGAGAGTRRSQTGRECGAAQPDVMNMASPNEKNRYFCSTASR